MKFKYKENIYWLRDKEILIGSYNNKAARAWFKVTDEDMLKVLWDFIKGED
jgi:hypothetical protein